MFIEPVILILMGAMFALAGWQGFRVPTDADGIAGLGETELKRRQLMLRVGRYACVISGATLILLAVILTYALVIVLGARRLF